MSVNMNDLAMTIYYSRHGESEANINLHALHVDRPKWLHYLRTHQIVDDKAKYFDTLLVEEGKIRVKESNAKFSDWFCENIDNTILLSSPNRRCVQTIVMKSRYKLSLRTYTQQERNFIDGLFKL